jgi:hypothetical protein
VVNNTRKLDRGKGERRHDFDKSVRTSERRGEELVAAGSFMEDRGLLGKGYWACRSGLREQPSGEVGQKGGAGKSFF